jgi:hypothetical protein
MKRTILIFTISIMINIVYAQNPDIVKIIYYPNIDQESAFTFGPQIGWLSTKLTSNVKDNYSDFNSGVKNGFEYGAFFRFGIKNYIQPEIYFSSKGGIMDYTVNQSSEITGEYVSQKITLRTIDIPVLFGHSFMHSRELNVRAFIGPVFSYIVDKKIDLNQGNGTQVLTKSDFKNGIGAGQIGAGVDVLMFTLNVRYEFGLNDISKSPNLSKTRNNLFLISLGWKIFY